MSGVLYQLDSVAFRYGPDKPFVLRSFSRNFRTGVTLLRGPSGGGKSTLLKLLAGFLPPSSGRVLNRHGRAPDALFARTEVGFVFQQFNLLPAATLRENLVLSAFAGLLPGSQIEASIQRWLVRLHLEQVADAPATDLSGGQLQRAAIARALIKTPALLLLDEPTSGLDDANASLIAQVVREACGTGASAIISTHDPRLSLSFPEADTLEFAAA